RRPLVQHLATPGDAIASMSVGRAGELAAGNSDGFQTRRRSERAQQTTHVVSHRLATEPQLLSDLRRRPSPLEQPQYLRLPRRQAHLRMRVRLLEHVRDLPEPSDAVLTPPKRDRADLDRDMSALGVDDDHGGVRDLAIAHDLARKDLPCPLRLLRG